QASGRELLAALGAAAIQDDAAILGGHARPEAVAAGTHDLGGLECTLHDIRPRRARFLYWLCSRQDDWAATQRQAPMVRVGGVYRENSPASQRAIPRLRAYVARLFSRPYRPINRWGSSTQYWRQWRISSNPI